jgi:hypothetical protein
VKGIRTSKLPLKNVVLYMQSLLLANVTMHERASNVLTRRYGVAISAEAPSPH